VKTGFTGGAITLVGGGMLLREGHKQRCFGKLLVALNT